MCLEPCLNVDIWLTSWGEADGRRVPPTIGAGGTNAWVCWCWCICWCMWVSLIKGMGGGYEDMLCWLWMKRLFNSWISSCCWFVAGRDDGSTRHVGKISWKTKGRHILPRQRAIQPALHGPLCHICVKPYSNLCHMCNWTVCTLLLELIEASESFQVLSYKNKVWTHNWFLGGTTQRSCQHSNTETVHTQNTITNTFTHKKSTRKIFHCLWVI